MDALVQLVRNGLCCIKDLKLFPDTLLHDPSHTTLYYNLPEPLNKTTPLEFLISACQFYAFLFVSLSGYRLIAGGLGKLRRMTRLLEIRQKSKGDGVADKIVNDSLAQEGSAAIRSIWVGANVFGIGVSFFWLFANSWHVTDTDWIGGLQGLIHALTIMEVGMLPLLYYMIKDGASKIGKSARMEAFADGLVACKGDFASTVGGKDLLNVESYGWTQKGGWSPFWAESAPLSPDNMVAEEKMLTKELEKIEATVSALLADAKKKNDTNVEAVQKAAEDAAGDLLEDARKERFEGFMEYLYFVFNFIAFYGYLLGIVVYYFDEATLKGTYTGSLKLGMSNSDSDWYGNFAGDFMWTVEPVFILGSPTMLSWLKPKKKKVKAD
uniref:Uncharacterized protein n=1 Tax=Odontella aurita TaxID=265563 RepID=A0A7S4IV48_9STRA|mmetsp:Transcript_30820/g.92330  ORF Transcript_30820/g.92330 Transcript_30820/m.92330 type:complete len:381 (+) Transcript_30820:195-1337(+)|eukprot:CAMPEP_0113544930 /NCGR_PEP_ID=MMETSP0015_2-20120614/10980_1 /TAXON_ID=2838 /ORGANISM="Odontella" /LENGTH=380 /DNA_ID=CAMNT_0000445241 /DNA_START=130 /DNA_END=1272 /DNA_ORIENTATION=- /assembly_acc=CAM_ASM_000160